MEKGIIAGLGVAALALVLVALYTGAEADYADLVPAPDSIVWRQGDETALWLSTNRHAVDVRIDSIALGVGEIDIRDPSSGAAVSLGEGLGCLDAVVSGLTVDDVTDTTATLTATLDRETVTFYWLYWHRPYPADGEPHATNPAQQISSASQSRTFTGLTEGTKYRVDASTDLHFPSAITRTVTFTAGDPDSGTTDDREEEVHLVEGTGVTLKACDDHEDVVVSIHGDDGAELNRYLVDILPAAATPTPGPSAPLIGQYVSRRVCAVATTSRAGYFDGDETVGASFTATVDGTALPSTSTTYALLSDGSADYAFFDVSDSGQLSVSDLGADDDSGLDASRLYGFVLQVTDTQTGLTGRANVAVQVGLNCP